MELENIPLIINDLILSGGAVFIDISNYCKDIYNNSLFFIIVLYTLLNTLLCDI